MIKFQNLFFCLALSVMLYSCDEEEAANVADKVTDVVDSTFTGTKTFAGTGSGTGTLSIADGNCKIGFTSKTTALTIVLTFAADTITSGTYALAVATEVDNKTSCNVKTFDETKTGTVAVSGNALSFTQAIGQSASLDNVVYSYTGVLADSVINGTVIHTSPSLESEVSYGVKLSSATN